MLANTIAILTPLLANVATRLITREGWGRLWLRPNFRRGWRFYLAAMLLPFLAVIVGASIFYLVFPGSFDPNLGEVRKLYPALSLPASTNPWMGLLIIALVSIINWLIKNSTLSIGEEFGWRAYLLPKMLAHFIGGEPAADNRLYASAARKASLLIGVIWGVWHWPLIIMGMGMDPSMTPIRAAVSLGLYVAFTCVLSVMLCWFTLRSGSVWPASIGHGFLNGTSSLPGLLLKGPANLLFGPGPNGLIGILGYLALALVLLFHPKAFAVRDAHSEKTPAVVEANI